MKEKRKGPLSRAAGIAEGWRPPSGACSASASRACSCTTRAGYARLVQPEARGHDRIMSLAEEMLSEVAGRE